MSIQFSRLVFLSALLAVSGCAGKDAFHHAAPFEGHCKDPAAVQCRDSYYQQHAGFDLAFAEYTERGNAFNDVWIADVLDRIDAYASGPGVVVVTFIHGWKHNADESDTNLLDFKSALGEIAADASLLRGKRLVGLYVGWRGKSIDLPLLDQLTFWDRKHVAEQVGHGGVTALLLALDEIERQQPGNVMVSVGHSFGGAILISAVTQVLTERSIKRLANGASGASIGDAVIVLNPAIEANKMLNLVEAARLQPYPEDQTPLFLSVSSDADWATHFAFPLGQTVGLLFTWHQHDLHRSYYRDRMTGQSLRLKEEHLDATTVGNFAPYLTHRLRADQSGATPQLQLTNCHEMPDACVPKGLTTLTGHPAIDGLPDYYPMYFIKTDGTVMRGHNDIFNPTIRAFMLSIIDDVVRSALANAPSEKAAAPVPVAPPPSVWPGRPAGPQRPDEEPAPSVLPDLMEQAPGAQEAVIPAHGLLNNPERLNRRFQEYFEAPQAKSETKGQE